MTPKLLVVASIKCASLIPSTRTRHGRRKARGDVKLHSTARDLSFPQFQTDLLAQRSRKPRQPFIHLPREFRVTFVFSPLPRRKGKRKFLHSTPTRPMSIQTLDCRRSGYTDMACRIAFMSKLKFSQLRAEKPSGGGGRSSEPELCALLRERPARDAAA